MGAKPYNFERYGGVQQHNHHRHRQKHRHTHTDTETHTQTHRQTDTDTDTEQKEATATYFLGLQCSRLRFGVLRGGYCDEDPVV